MNGLEKLEAFFAQEENGVSNLEKVREKQKIIRRLPTTDQSRSYEASDSGSESDALPGTVIKDGKLIGFGIHIFNEDVYPLKYFEIYLRSCGLSGELDISGCEDMVFLDLYHNQITGVRTADLPAMRIFGVQDNRIGALDCSGMPACQGIDAGKNQLERIDVSRNPELVELYVNDNRIREVDLSQNQKLKYFYCHNNAITELDTRHNSHLRHLNATGNPMKKIICLAPQREERLPLELYAKEGGCVGLRFNPVYNAQWKETGEWQQSYYACPNEGRSFKGWHDETGKLVSAEAVWNDEYGASRILTAEFEKIEDYVNQSGDEGTDSRRSENG